MVRDRSALEQGTRPGELVRLDLLLKFYGVPEAVARRRLARSRVPYRVRGGLIFIERPVFVNMMFGDVWVRDR